MVTPKPSSSATELAYDVYYSRLEERLKSCADATKRVLRIKEIAESGDDHFVRLAMAKRRLKRAEISADKLAIEFEKEIILALIYEIMDTCYITVSLLDFSVFDLESSADGIGLSGSAASSIVKILSSLDKQCKDILSIEQDLGLMADFEKAVDEREGITYLSQPHWQDFEGPNASQSFTRYFKNAQDSVKTWLSTNPSFWANQSVEDYLRSKGYPGLLAVLCRLRNAKL